MWDTAECGKLQLDMARGWESKDVESQLELAEAARRARGVAKKAVEDAEVDAKRESLELSRRGVLRDLDAATHPRHRQQLERALAFLDEAIKKFETPR